MGPLSKEKVKRQKAKGQERGPLPFAFCLLPFAFCLAGCASTGSFFHPGGDKPCVAPCQVVVAWNPEVVSTPDPTHGGSPTPGLAGRIYLFGPEIGRPLSGDGSLVVELYDDAATANGKASAPLEEWHFDRDTLKRLQRRDAVGWGYTVFLPWATYKPEITQVHLKVRYEPPNGGPLYAASAPMTLADPAHTSRWETGLSQGMRKGDRDRREGYEQATASAQGSSTAAPRQMRQ